MKFEEHIIFCIDEYILLKNDGNEFLSLVEHYFRGNKLVFSLLEMVLLNENGIGETHIFAKKDFNAKEFYSKYYELVNQFKTKFNGGISSYKEWYHQNTWLYIGRGGQIDNQPYAIKEYCWLENFEPRKIKSYGEKSGLTRKIIEDYLNEYADKIANLELNKHPYFFIIIQPINRSDNEKITPYGNLYLHFATLEEVELEDIKDFLREFMIIWYKCYGGQNLKTVLKNLVKQVVSNKEVSYYLPNVKGTNQDGLEYLFMNYFFKEDNIKIFKDKASEFIEKLDKYRDSEYNDISHKFNDLKKTPYYSQLIKVFDETTFEKFIFKRALAIFLFIIKGYTIEQTKDILMKKSSKENADNASHLDYFYQYLLIYFSKLENENSLRTKLKDDANLSEFEKSIIAKFSIKS